MEKTDHETHDWEVLELPGVHAAIAASARSVSDPGEWLDLTDLEQEAAEALATNSRHRVGAFEEGVPALGRIYFRMRRVMQDRIKTERRRQATFGLYPLVYAASESGEESERATLNTEEMGTAGDYTPAVVRALLEAMVAGADVSFGGAARSGDELRARRTSMNYSLCVADVRRAWERADLTLHQRRALWLEALGYTQEEAGQCMGGQRRSTVNEHIQKGAERLADYLMGAAAVVGTETAHEAA